MADIKIKIPTDMETDVYDAFWEAYPPDDPDNTTKEQNCLNHIDEYVSLTYLAYMDNQALDSIKGGAETDYEDEKTKNKDKAKEIEVT